MNDIFQLESLASCSSGCDGVCITSLSIGGDQVLVGENNNLTSFWIDGDQNYCMDDFMSSPQIQIKNGQVISSKCKDRKLRTPLSVNIKSIQDVLTILI